MTEKLLRQYYKLVIYPLVWYHFYGNPSDDTIALNINRTIFLGIFYLTKDRLQYKKCSRDVTQSESLLAAQREERPCKSKVG